MSPGRTRPFDGTLEELPGSFDQYQRLAPCAGRRAQLPARAAGSLSQHPAARRRSTDGLNLETASVQIRTWQVTVFAHCTTACRIRLALHAASIPAPSCTCSMQLDDLVKTTRHRQLEVDDGLPQPAPYHAPAMRWTRAPCRRFANHPVQPSLFGLNNKRPA